jgi:hypothetical protein
MVPRMAEGHAAPAGGRYSQWFVIVVAVKAKAFSTPDTHTAVMLTVSLTD